MKRTISGFYESYDTARDVVTDLEKAGVPHADISIIASNGDKLTTGATGAGTGGSLGAVVGGGAGLLAGLGMLAIPGLGPVVAAGWLAATAAGAAAGAAAGGVIGALTGAGVSKEHANIYAEGVRRGGSLVTARVDDDEQRAAQMVIDRHDPSRPDRLGAGYRASGWERFDENAPLYTPESGLIPPRPTRANY